MALKEYIQEVKKNIFTYILGMCAIGLIIQPYWVFHLLVDRSDLGGNFLHTWLCGIIAEVLIISVLSIPYKIGRYIIKVSK